MLSRHVVIEDLANSLAQRRREVLRDRARQVAIDRLARAVMLHEPLAARSLEGVGRCGQARVLDAA
jgi:hypothetical protein